MAGRTVNKIYMDNSKNNSPFLRLCIFIASMTIVALGGIASLFVSKSHSLGFTSAVGLSLIAIGAVAIGWYARKKLLPKSPEQFEVLGVNADLTQIYFSDVSKKFSYDIASNKIQEVTELPAIAKPITN